MSRFRGSLCVVLFSLVILTGCASRGPARSESQAEPARGEVLKIELIGFSIRRPPEWRLATKDEKGEIIQEGKQIFAEEDEEFQQAVAKASEEALEKGFVLLLESEDEFVIVTVVVEDISQVPEIHTNEDYLRYTVELLRKTSAPVRYQDDIRTQKLGGVEFGVINGRMGSPEDFMEQQMYVAILKRHAFIIAATYAGPKGLKHIESLLGTIRFR